MNNLHYNLHRLRVFAQTFGRQDSILYEGNCAPYEKPHLWKTRTGVRQAWVIATVCADIKFDRL